MFDQRISITQNNSGGAAPMLALIVAGGIVAVIVGEALAAILTVLLTVVVITGCACLTLATLTGITLAVLRHRRTTTALHTANGPATLPDTHRSPFDLAGRHPTTGQPLTLTAGDIQIPTVVDQLDQLTPFTLTHDTLHTGVPHIRAPHPAHRHGSN